MIRKKFIVVAIVMLGLVFFAPGVIAVESEGSGSTETQNPRPAVMPRLDESNEQSRRLPAVYEQKLDEKKTLLESQIKEQTQSARTEKLDDAKKKICETKTDGIKTRMEKISETGQKHRDFLNSASEKINSFVTKNSLVVENYDSMLTDIENAKASLEASHEVLKTYKDKFSCDSEPKAIASEFQSALQSMKDAEKTYKSSVKTLLDAVRSAAQAAGISEAKNSDTNENTNGGNQ